MVWHKQLALDYLGRQISVDAARAARVDDHHEELTVTGSGSEENHRGARTPLFDDNLDDQLLTAAAASRRRGSPTKVAPRGRSAASGRRRR